MYENAYRKLRTQTYFHARTCGSHKLTVAPPLFGEFEIWKPMRSPLPQSRKNIGVVILF